MDGHHQTEKKMATTYGYKLNKASELCHAIMAGEREPGLQAFIFKDCVKIKDDMMIHATLVDTLFKDRPDAHRDLVFLQVAPPASAFKSYAEEKNKLPMTLTAYLELLKLFRTDHAKLVKKIDSDLKNMTSHSEWFALTPYIFFRGPAVIVFKIMLDSTPNGGTLNLIIVKEFKHGQIVTTLGYSDEHMGSPMPLPVLAIKQLARDLPTISNLVDYKDTSPVKRARQL